MIGTWRLRLTSDVCGGGGVLDGDQTSGGIAMSDEREQESEEQVKAKMRCIARGRHKWTSWGIVRPTGRCYILLATTEAVSVERVQ